MLSRFLHIQIYNLEHTQVEYDNKTDSSWGITLGTASLDRILMAEELRYGEIHSSMFQVQVFGLMGVNLDKRPIHVYLQQGEYAEEEVFRGYIDTSKKDRSDTYRNIVAYDWFHYYREFNVADWWNGFWSEIREEGVLATQDNELITTQDGQLIVTRQQPVTLKQLKHSLFDYLSNLWRLGELDISYNEVMSSVILYNEDILVENPYPGNLTVLKLETILGSIGTLQNITFHIDADGVIRPYQLESSEGDHNNLSHEIEGDNSEWEDYTTEEVTGVAIYDTSSNIQQMVGEANNVYKIVGNILLLNKSAEELTTIANTILDGLQGVVYTPCNVNLIQGQYFKYALGVCHQLDDDGNIKIYTMRTTNSGSLFIDQNIQATALGKKLSDDVESFTDTEITSMKYARIEHDLDEFRIEYGDFADNTETMLSLMAGQAVLKVRNDRSVASMELTADPTTEEGDTRFTISADNIDFIANNIMQLAAKNIGINAENFSINPETGEVSIDGRIIAKSGIIGGFNISSSKPEDADNTSANGGHYYTNSLWVHVTDSTNTYEYEVGIEGGNRSTTSRTFYVIRIPYGATWTAANVEDIFVVRKDGKLIAQNTEVGKLTFTDKLVYNSSFNTSLLPGNYDFIVPYSLSSGQGIHIRNLRGQNAIRLPLIDTFEAYYGELLGKWRINGFSITSENDGSYWNIVPTVSSSDGVMEIGKIIDFHMTASHTSDYSFRLTNNADGQLIASGTITQGSSRKIKENIEEIPVEEAEKILDLNPVKFDYTHGIKDRRGFIAEEVAEVLPNLVTPETEDIPASLDYNGIIPYLVKMVQKQQQEIDELKRRLDNG